MTKIPSADLAGVLRAHEAACRADEAGYMDPSTGLFVLTSGYLRKRSRCCGNGCRHCPFDLVAQRAAKRPADAPAYPFPPSTERD